MTVDVHDLVRYDPETGAFTWKSSGPYGRLAGARAEGRHSEGYLRVRVAPGHRVFAHRLAWFMTHGEWPAGLIDHKNGNRTDNRIANLRVVPGRSANAQNMQRLKPGESGHIGVSFVRRTGRWAASIAVDRKSIHIGYFSSAEEACAAYRAEKATRHPFWIERPCRACDPDCAEGAA